MDVILLLFFIVGIPMAISFGIPLLFSKRYSLGLAFLFCGIIPTLFLMNVQIMRGWSKGKFFLLVLLCSVWSWLEGFLTSRFGKEWPRLILVLKIFSRVTNALVLLVVEGMFALSGGM